MSSAAVEMDDYTPHVCLIDATGQTYMFPVGMLDKIITGELDPADVTGWDNILPVILSDWLDYATSQRTGS